VEIEAPKNEVISRIKKFWKSEFNMDLSPDGAQQAIDVFANLVENVLTWDLSTDSGQAGGRKP